MSLFLYKYLILLINIIKSIFSPTSGLQNNIVNHNKERRIQRNQEGIKEKKRLRIQAMFNACELVVKVQNKQKNQITLHDEIVHNTIYPKLSELIVNGEKCVEIEFPMDFNNPEPTLRKFLPKISEDLNNISKEFSDNPDQYEAVNYVKLFVKNDKRTFRIFENKKKNKFVCNNIYKEEQQFLSELKTKVKNQNEYFLGNLVNPSDDLALAAPDQGYFLGNIKDIASLIIVGTQGSGKTETGYSLAVQWKYLFPNSVMYFLDGGNKMGFDPFALKLSPWPVAKCDDSLLDPNENAAQLIDYLYSVFLGYQKHIKVVQEFIKTLSDIEDSRLIADNLYVVNYIAKKYDRPDLEMNHQWIIMDEMAMFVKNAGGSIDSLCSTPGTPFYKLLNLIKVGRSLGFHLIMISQKKMHMDFGPFLKEFPAALIHKSVEEFADQYGVPRDVSKLTQGQFYLEYPGSESTEAKKCVFSNVYMGGRLPRFIEDLPDQNHFKYKPNYIYKKNSSDENISRASDLRIKTLIRGLLLDREGITVLPESESQKPNNMVFAIIDVNGETQNLALIDKDDVVDETFFNRFKMMEPIHYKNKTWFFVRGNFSTVKKIDEIKAVVESSGVHRVIIENDFSSWLRLALDYYVDNDPFPLFGAYMNEAPKAKDEPINLDKSSELKFELSLPFYDSLFKLKNTDKKGDLCEQFYREIIKARYGFSVIITHDLFKLHPEKGPAGWRETGADYGVDLVIYKNETDFKTKNSLDPEDVIFGQVKCYNEASAKQFMNDTVLKELKGSRDMYSWLLKDPDQIHKTETCICTRDIFNKQANIVIKELNMHRFDRSWVIKTLAEIENMKQSEIVTEDSVVYIENAFLSKSTEDSSLSIRKLKEKYKIGTNKALKYKELLNTSIEEALAYLEAK